MDLRGKRIIISVISDLVTDQRVHRTAVTLRGQGAVVQLVGRKRKGSLAMNSRAYRTVRFRLPFETGPLFYAAYNLRLLLFLLFTRFDFLVANDLDTLPANFLAARLKRKPLLYDSHEYFTEVPELTGRPRIQRIWKKIERYLVPRLKVMITVNESIATLFRNEYNIPVRVVRNIPSVNNFEGQDIYVSKTRADYGLPADRVIFLLQGAGINMHRGAEEAVEAMQYVNGGLLLFVGSGDVIDHLQQRVADLGLTEKVKFIPKVQPTELRRITKLADFGLTLDKDTNLNYRFSLPNKLFDYIHAGLPVLASDLPEVRRIIDRYDIGILLPAIDPSSIASAMNQLAADDARISKWKENLIFASGELTWDREQSELLAAIQDAR